MDVYCVESFSAEFDYNGRHSVGVKSEGYPRESGPVYLHLVAVEPSVVRDLKPHVTARNSHGRLAIESDAPWWFQAGRAAKAHWPGIRQLRNRGVGGAPVALFQVSD